MKAKRYQNKLIQLQILKLYYKKKYYTFKTNVKQMEIHLNKISNIIYKYHITNRKILFIGFPEDFTKTLHNTKHLLIPESVWFNGMLSNRSSYNSQTITKKQAKVPTNINQLLLKLKKKLDLVIIYNLSNGATAIEESYVSRLPVITLNKNLDILDNKSTYKSPGNYSLVNEKIINNNTFYSLIKTTLHRAIKTKNLKFRNITKSFFQKKKKFYKKTFFKRKNTKSLKKSNDFKSTTKL